MKEQDIGMSLNIDIGYLGSWCPYDKELRLTLVDKKSQYLNLLRDPLFEYIIIFF